MVFKQKDSEEPKIRFLELRIKQCRDAKERSRLEKTLGMLRAGAKGEHQSAYHIDFLLKKSANWAVIHDLRIELHDRVAQIDHILINRFLEIYVIESKSFRKKIRYENGGWERLDSNNYWQGIESPVDQNENHILVLKDLIDTQQLAPTRFGLRPNFINIVSVQGSCSIIGKLPPKTKVERVDSLVRKLQKQEPSILWLLKIISPETLHAFAQALVTYHRPIEPPKNAIALHDALGPQPVGARSIRAPLPQLAPAAPKLDPPPKTQQSSSTPIGRNEPSAQTCQTCSGPLSPAEVRFCTERKARFEGKLLCRSCQPAPTAKRKITIAPQHRTNISKFPAAQKPSVAITTFKAPPSKHDQRMEEIRKKHPRAYEQWTIAEQSKLTELFTTRTSINEIAETLQRRPGAIRARLEKLHLLEPSSERAATGI
jgi:hypothetical protein